MSKFEQRDMSGVLFKNENRSSEKHPHAKGTALIEGKEYWVSAWTKEGQKGKFQSLSFERKQEQRGKKPARHDDDEAPF